MKDLTSLPPENQLDFWLGNWEVRWGEDQRGSNHVLRILDGKAIQENFSGSPAMEFLGMSISVYTRHGKWQQTWADSQGSYWHFTGEVTPDTFIFATEDVINGEPVLLRMVFFNIEDDALDWRWERSTDGGETWTVTWQLKYFRQDL